MIVKIKLLHENAVLPKKAHNSDACYDCVATSVKNYGDGRLEYGLGFSLELPENTQLDLRARSSIYKTGMILTNGIGTGDQGYTGEYKVVFYHLIDSLPIYEVGDRICQIQLKVRADMDFQLSEELVETERGGGGYGSTGN